MERAIKLLAMALTLPLLVGTLTLNVSAASVAGYADVDADAPYAEAVETLKKAGIMTGIGGDKFAPELSVTRAQAITVLGRLAGVKPVETGQFTDIIPGSWYSGYVGWAAENSIVEGDDEGKFMPDVNVTSDHLDSMLSRYSEISGVAYTAAGTGAASVSRAELAMRLLVFLKEEEVTSSIKLPAAKATFQGNGLTMEGEAADITYDAEANAILHMDAGASATYTVPDGIDGEYDVYFEIGRSISPVGTTPFRLQINGEAQYLLPVTIGSVATADLSDLNDMGIMQIAASKKLKAGDKPSICAQLGYGVNFDPYHFNFLPSIGDMYLYPAGTEVAVGYNGGTVKTSEPADPSDPLSGLRIAWLGSSVTYGMQSGGYTMADEIAAKHPATESYKYAISATTLVNDLPTSYVTRMKEIDPDMPLDLFVVQLSTNDATNGKPLGTLTDSKDPSTFDDTTIIGAIESIIAYVKDTWDCPVVFYTGSYYDSDAYAAMVDTLLKIQQKWNIDVVDLWNNEEMTAIYNSELYHSYMGDEIHPVRKGYVEWWTPVFESALTEILSK